VAEHPELALEGGRVHRPSGAASEVGGAGRRRLVGPEPVRRTRRRRRDWHGKDRPGRRGDKRDEQA
jgi:hypothetical protein